MAAGATGELQPAKVPLHPIDIVNSKKAIAMRNEHKRKLGKQRSYGATMDYSPLAIDKHEPEFVSAIVEKSPKVFQTFVVLSDRKVNAKSLNYCKGRKDSNHWRSADGTFG